MHVTGDRCQTSDARARFQNRAIKVRESLDMVT
jgi:hypothetical protein